MKDGFRVIDSDLHVIEAGDVYEKYFDEKYRDQRPRYLGWSPTNFPHWQVHDQLIPPWARSDDVIGPQKFLDAPTEDIYRSVRERNYEASATLGSHGRRGH